MRTLDNCYLLHCRRNNYKVNRYKLGSMDDFYLYKLDKTEIAYISHEVVPNHYKISFKINKEQINASDKYEAFGIVEKVIEEYTQNIEKELHTMQTVLESLECSYINILNLESDANREDSNSDTYIREEIYEAKKELIKAIFLLVVTQDVIPTDNRVYLDLIETSIYKESQSEEIKKEFIEKLYKAEILHREKTIGDLIEELKQFSPSLKIQAYGGKKLVVDDTYTDKVVLVGVEN